MTNATGEEAIAQLHRYPSATKGTKTSDHHLGEYVVVTSAEISERRGTIAKRSDSTPASSKTERPKPYRIRGLLFETKNQVSKCERVIREDADVEDKYHELSKLWDLLSQLWEERSFRERQFGKLVTLIQTAAKSVAFENYTRANMESIASAILELSSGNVTSEDIRESIETMQLGGLSPFGKQAE